MEGVRGIRKCVCSGRCRTFSTFTFLFAFQKNNLKGQFTLLKKQL